MPANNRTVAQREHDRLEITRRYLKGESQPQIAEALGITRSLVSYDLQVIQDRWRQSGLYDLNEARGRELARIDEVEREAWQAWADSKQDKQIAVQRSGGGDREKPLTVKEAMLRKEGQSGNPAFLTIVLDCIERRSKLLGLDAPAKHGSSIILNITDARERLAHKLFEATAASDTYTVASEPER